MGMHYFPNRYRGRCFGCNVSVEVGVGFAHRVAGHGANLGGRLGSYGVSCAQCKDRYDQEERRLQDSLRVLHEDYIRRTTKMKTDRSQEPQTNRPPTLAFYISMVNTKIGFVADVASKIDDQVVGMDENDPNKTVLAALPPKWPGAYIENAPGLKLGVFNTTLVKAWHEKWRWEVGKRQQENPLLQALLSMYSKALAEVEALLGQELVRLENSFPEPSAPSQAAPPY